jgi:hypothetical protein
MAKAIYFLTPYTQTKVWGCLNILLILKFSLGLFKIYY